MLRSFALAALAALSYSASAQLSSDAAWARFGQTRPGDERVTEFNRFVFREYANLALLLGEAYSDRVAFLEDFLLYFPRTVVISGHAALTNWAEQAERLKVGELNLFVFDERTLPVDANLSPLLTQVDAWNRDGYVVKVVVHVTDPASVANDLAFRAQSIEFTPGYAAEIRRAREEYKPVPRRAKVWRDLIEHEKGRRKLVMKEFSDVFRSPSQALIVLAGTPESNAGVSELVRRELNLAPVLEYAGEARQLVPPDPRRRFDVNLVRVRVSNNLIGQWPPPEGLGHLADTLATVNRDGLFTRSIIEVTDRVQLPRRIRAQSRVVASSHGCESLIRWSD